MEKEMDLYTDYVLSCFGQVTATGLSSLLDGSISHDRITRMLLGQTYNSRDLWQEVNPLVHAHESEDVCLIFDNTIVSKSYKDENEYWEHSKNRNEKGINLLTAFYHTQIATESQPLRVLVAFECVKKTVHYCDLKTRKEKRQSSVTKNEMLRSMVQQAVVNKHLKFRYVLTDSWFASSENILFIDRLQKYFMMDFKSNHLCMFSTEDRNKGQWISIDKLQLQPEQPVKVWIKDLEIAIILCKFVFTNRYGSTGEMYLVSNDVELSAKKFRTLYKERWSVEEYHKSLKQNASLSKSSTRTVTT